MKKIENTILDKRDRRYVRNFLCRATDYINYELGVFEVVDSYTIREELLKQFSGRVKLVVKGLFPEAEDILEMTGKTKKISDKIKEEYFITLSKRVERMRGRYPAWSPGLWESLRNELKGLSEEFKQEAGLVEEVKTL